MQRTPLVALVTLLVFAAAPARAITIEQAMADPDWIGPPVQQPYWSVDGRSIYYTLKQKGTAVRDLHRIDVADGKDTRIDAQAMANADGADPVFDRARTRAAFVRNGDVFIRDVANGRLIQVTRTPQEETAPQFSAAQGVEEKRAREPVLEAAGGMHRLVLEQEADARESGQGQFQHGRVAAGIPFVEQLAHRLRAPLA